MKKLAFLTLLIVITIMLFLKFNPLVAQDACLDSGGAWEQGTCMQ